MAGLSSARVNTSRPFSQVGTDFARPFVIKLSKRRNTTSIKGYLRLFICFATKVVHLEFISSLDTEVFLVALDRFMALRGLPESIYLSICRIMVAIMFVLLDI